MIILNDGASDMLYRDIEANMRYYRDYQEPWIQIFVEELNSVDFRQDDTLIVSNDPTFDTENAIRLYENNKLLSTTIASSNHYWTTLAHTNFYKYMKLRWPVKTTTKKSYVETRYFFNSSSQKSRARHGLTRLWWIGHLTYDETNDSDPYYYTKLATEDQELFNLIMETKHVAQNKTALFAMLDTLSIVFELQEEGKISTFNKRTFFREMMKQINLIGSVSVWDMLSGDEAMKKLMSFTRMYFGIKEKVYIA